MISSLPDGILHHILSHFSTDEVVRLSLLSTRWKYLWTSIPNLDFSDRLVDFTFKSSDEYLDYHNPKRVQNFQNFVDRVLSHHGTSNIHEFHLDCTGIYCGSRFETWISTLSKHKLGELVLRVGGDTFTLPNFLAISESLTVLELNNSSDVLVPSSICFPNLKILHFIFVLFHGDKSTQEVSFSFPVLEEFKMFDCNWLEIRTVNIYAPTLKKLNLGGSKYSSGLYESEVKMDAMNIMALSILGRICHDYRLIYLPSLFEASVDVGRSSENKRLVKCFASLNHVKNLTLSDRCIKNLFTSDIFNSLQVFSSLISLTVTRRSNNAFSPKHLIKLLCYMPNIECLVIELNSGDHDDDADRSWTHETVPQCSLLNLKSVEIIHFSGSENEQGLIAYLLVRTLEKMIISFNLHWDDTERDKIVADLLILPRGSEGTQIILR
ncbi:hypothetical protein ACHQM5_013860 [Ranunculus cassubicifolius]